MSLFKSFIFLAIIITLTASTGFAQNSSAPSGLAAEDSVMGRVWHLGRVTGDLERIIQFYHDLLGLDLRGERNAPIPFYSVDTVNEFVNAAPGTEFRAAFFPIQGASAETEQQNQIYLEAFEYRNIDRQLTIPALYDTGVSSLKFWVRDLDHTIEEAEARGVTIITTGGEAIVVPTLAGLSGSTRAIMLRDPDGYPVELFELTPRPQITSQITIPETSNILGAHMSVVVESIESSLRFYRGFVGSALQTWQQTEWQNGSSLSLLRNTPDAEYKTATMLMPGSSIILELIEYRDLEQTPYRPVFQDIGFGHVAFMVNDIEEVYRRMNALDVSTISESGTWTQINPATRAIYTRDYDGFFLEIIEIQ